MRRSCEACGRGIKAAEESGKRTFECHCGTRWWQYNTVYHLWSQVDGDDDATWGNIQGGCLEQPVATGNPTRNMYPRRRKLLILEE